jgi:signal transduction histidine kinase
MLGRGPARLLVESADKPFATLVRAAYTGATVEVVQTQFPSETLRTLRDRGADVLLLDCRAGMGLGSAESALQLAPGLVCVPVIRHGAATGQPFPFPLGPSDCLSEHELDGGPLPRLIELVAARQAAARTGRAEADAYRRRIAQQQEELDSAREEIRLAQESVATGERTTAIEQLVVTIRHEINNPLATLVGRAQLLRAKGKNAPEPVLKALEEIEREALRIRTLMDRLDAAREGKTTGYLDRRRIKLD